MKAIEERKEILPAIGMLRSLPERIRQDLTEAGSFQTVSAGTKIAHQGLDHHSLWVVLSGRLRVSCHAHGDHVDLALLGPGDTVGEMSLLDSRPPSADVTVIDRPARLWAIASDRFHEFLEADRSRGFELLKVLGSELSLRLRKNSDHLLNQAEIFRSHFLDIDY